MHYKVGVPSDGPSAEKGLIQNAMTVDVEDYYQVQALSECVDRKDWDRYPSRVERNTDLVLELFASHGVHGTFFTLGWVAERYPSLVRRVVDAGHELASHGYAHHRVDHQTREEFRADVGHSKRLLEDIGGTAVKGYRAASFSVGANTPWAHEILAQEGYVYSSSVYPIRHDLYGMPDAPRWPYLTGGAAIVEIPLTTVRVGKRNWPSGGGGYFRLLPYSYSRWALRRSNELEGRPGIFYFHPWEVDPGQPRQAGLSTRSRLRHYSNLSRMEEKLRRLLADFSWGRMDEVFFSSTTKGSEQATGDSFAYPTA